MSAFPTEADVVVIGGGIAGVATAYHLSALGAGRVVLLEQNELGAGTTWHAAGAVGRMRTSAALARLNDRSATMYARMEAETGLPTGWVENGSLSIARTADRMTQLRRAAGLAGYYGVAIHEVGVREIEELWPLVATDDLIGGVWLPNDGIVHPLSLVRAIAEGARRHGASIHEGVAVTELTGSGHAVTGVRTNQSDIAVETVVLCTGMWTPQLARLAGLRIPLQPVEHHYVMSNPLDAPFDTAPVVRDPDGSIYFRGRDGRLMLGAFQSVSKPWLVDRVPGDFSFRLLDPDWEHFAPPLKEGFARLPRLKELGIEQFINGPESFTPDGSPLIGPLPGWRGLFICSGFNSSGLAYAGGVSEMLSQWILDGEPDSDLWALDVRRFSPDQSDPHFLRARGVEVLGTHMRLAYPGIEWERGRGLKRSPLYERLASRHAQYGEKFGIERPNWFGEGTATHGTFGRPEWLDVNREEHLATRERAAVFDQSSFAKCTVEGPDALEMLQRCCANQVDVEPGQLVYTAMLSGRGTFASDLTVMRLDETRFRVITGTAQRVSDLDWLRAHVGRAERVQITDVTEEWAVLGLMGPASREILGMLSSADLSDEAFPFLTAQEIEVAGLPCCALRVTYVGELGWEIQIPWDRAGEVYDALHAAAGPELLRDAGYYTINSLRLEMGYRQWGTDIGLGDTPLEAGLSFAVAWDKAVPFHGREALLRQREEGLPKRRLVSVVLEDSEQMLWGGERLIRGGQVIGYTTSGAYGHSIGAAVGLGYVQLAGEPVTEDLLEASLFEVDVGDHRVPARASLLAPMNSRRARSVVS
jgi:glycine cleavage system aminomethyltransferase T/glycine/D-amino acid oxidase-like deaminating enzyme